jgi:adenine-specific DNA-methyltransferase
VATFVPENIFTLNTVYNVYLKEKDINDINFILGVINSNTTKFFWRKNHSDEKKTFPKIKKEAICSIPIPIIDKKNQRRKNDVVNLVQELLNLNKEKAETKLLPKINVLQEKIDYCKSKINKIVYELYGLNEEEIKVIESELEK